MAALLKGLLGQILALLVIVGVFQIVRWPLPVVVWLVLQAVLACLVARWFRLPVWWQVIQLFFLPAFFLVWSLHFPSVLYLALFLVLLLVFWGTASGDVPLFLSSEVLCQVLIERLQRLSARQFIELGAGIGSVVVPVARALPQLNITAVERAPLPWLILRWRCRKLRNVQVVRGNFWDLELQRYDVAFAFLSPLVMPPLAEKIQAEMPAGAWLFSSSFVIPGWKPRWHKMLDDWRQTALYAYRVTRN